MNLTPHYINVSKILRRLTILQNNVFRIIPVKWLISFRTRNYIRNVNKYNFKQKLTHTLGKFDDFAVHFVNEKEKIDILTEADQVMNHQFDLLGSGLIKLDPIDWHTDFKSGFTWGKGKFYKKYKKVNLANNADVKIPWELSRCHHLLWLGEAYLLTKDEKYAREIVRMIDHWISENPVMYSINWTCAMDVAIRAVNWIYAINMIINSEQVTEVFIKKITGILYLHCFFIYRNLEKEFPNSANHYAADITGLLFFSQLFLETKAGKKWSNFALVEYYNEVRQQILPTGVHYERSTSYHRLMTELLFYPLLMLKRIGITIPQDVQHRVQSMFEFILYYTKPDGQSPIIGDNDDGRLLPFIKYDFTDHRYLLSIAAIVFSNSLYKKYSGGHAIDSYFLIGTESEKTYNSIDESDEELSSNSFPDAGFCIMRYKDFYVFINNSGLSRYPDPQKKTLSTHTHADLLSFELAKGDQTFILDPGAYVYTSSPIERNEFRSSSKHNTITIDHLDQHMLSKTNLFSVMNFAIPKDFRFSVNSEIEEFFGSYNWNIHSNQPVSHSRMLRLTKEDFNCLIIDQLEFVGSHEFTWNFHISPKMTISSDHDLFIIKSPKGPYLEMSFDCASELTFKIADDTVSPSYGKKNESKVLRISAKSDSTFEMKTIIKYCE